jgi:hypothetical protein
MSYYRNSGGNGLEEWKRMFSQDEIFNYGKMVK